MEEIGRYYVMHSRAALVIAVAVCSLSPLIAKAQGPQQPAPAPDGVRELPTGRQMPDLSTITFIDSRDVQTPPPPTMPAARDGWVVEIIASGGIMGGTRRTVIDSAGSVTCPSSCATNVVPRALVAVTTSVEAASGVTWSSASPVNVSLCRDCVTTRLSLWRRDADGAIRTSARNGIRRAPEPWTRPSVASTTRSWGDRAL
jgi:hypothetical protein